MSKAAPMSPLEFAKESRRIDIQNAIEDEAYAREQAVEAFNEESKEDYYNNLIAEAQAVEFGRLEGQMEFLEKYKDEDPETYRLAKLLLGIND